MAKYQLKWQTPGVVFQPRVYEGLKRGINTLVEAIRPTLGPLPRLVVNEKASKTGRPEMLDDGAVIARRIIQLQDRDEDMGAMYLRQTLWSMHESVGDGTVTAALMFQAIFNEGLRYITAGGNAMRLRQHLEAACRGILDELETKVIHLHGKEQLARQAETICHDAPMAKMLGEIFDIIGEYGSLDIRPGRSRELEREYVEGMYWAGGLLSREMIQDSILGRAQLDNTAIFISDLEIKESQDLLPLLEMAVRADIKSLLLVAASISSHAMPLLLINREKIQVIAVKAPGLDTIARSEALEDLALLTGGRALFQAAGESLNSLQVTDLGQTRRAWANKDNFGIIGGKGDPRRLREHIARLRLAFKNVDSPNDRKRQQERIGKLMGGSAILMVGANTPLDVEVRKALGERTAEAMRGMLRAGVLPGGGVALLACQESLKKKMHAAENTDERVAYRILGMAMEAPIRALISNAGFNPDRVLSQIAAAGPGLGFDVVREQVLNMNQAGIQDSASVVQAAIFSAIHGAALALTIDVLIHRKSPPPSYHTT